MRNLVLLILVGLLLGGCAGAVTLRSKEVPASAAPAKAFTWPEEAKQKAVAQVHASESGLYVALSCPTADKLLEIKEISWAGNGGGGIYLFAKLAKPLIPIGKPQAVAFARADYTRLRQPPPPPKWVSLQVNDYAYVGLSSEDGVVFTPKDGYACEFREAPWHRR